MTFPNIFTVAPKFPRAVPNVFASPPNFPVIFPNFSPSAPDVKTAFPKTFMAVHGKMRVVAAYLGFNCGNRITLRMFTWPSGTIHRRSMPMPEG
jgi:hypothetical protein